MRSFPFHVLLAAGMATGFAVATATAAPTGTEAIALYKGADRQAVLEAGAKKEGTVQIYAVGTQIQPIIDAYQKRYPGIKVVMFRGTSDEIARKVIEEYKAKRHTVDAFELSTNGLVPINGEKVLIPFHTSEAAAYPDDAWGPNRHWVAARLSFTGIGVNTSIIPVDQAPKSFDDLLNPKWKGKIAISNSRSTSVSWTAVMLLEKGEDFVKKIGEQDIKVYPMTGRALANLMVAGEVSLSPTTYDSHVFASKKKGAALEWFDPGAVPVTDTAVAIAKHAPHPHATLLFLDFALSKEGQELYKKIGYASSRTDIEGQIKLKKLHYLANRPDFLEKFDGEWGRAYDRYILKKGR